MQPQPNSQYTVKYPACVHLYSQSSYCPEGIHGYIWLKCSVQNARGLAQRTYVTGGTNILVRQCRLAYRSGTVRNNKLQTIHGKKIHIDYENDTKNATIFTIPKTLNSIVDKYHVTCLTSRRIFVVVKIYIHLYIVIIFLPDVIVLKWKWTVHGLALSHRSMPNIHFDMLLLFYTAPCMGIVNLLFIYTIHCSSTLTFHSVSIFIFSCDQNTN